jgi:hypothetical protein
VTSTGFATGRSLGTATIRIDMNGTDGNDVGTGRSDPDREHLGHADADDV